MGSGVAFERHSLLGQVVGAADVGGEHGWGSGGGGGAVVGAVGQRHGLHLLLVLHACVQQTTTTKTLKIAA